MGRRRSGNDALGQATCTEHPWRAQCWEALAGPATEAGTRNSGRRAREKGDRGGDARPSGRRPGGGRRVRRALPVGRQRGEDGRSAPATCWSPGGQGRGHPRSGSTIQRSRAWLCSPAPGDKSWITSQGTLGT